MPYRKTCSPGPGAYDEYGKTANGNNFPSHFHTIKSPTFGFGERTDFAIRNKTPGPGTYRLPSDFGHPQTVDINEKILKSAA